MRWFDLSVCCLLEFHLLECFFFVLKLRGEGGTCESCGRIKRRHGLDVDEQVST